MVHVDLTTPDGKPPEVGLYGLPGLETSPRIPLENYWIDRYEVTNTEFKRFIDQGGYQKPEFWKHEFKKDGHLLTWLDAMKLFRDSTGKPGPAAWSYGKYPQGEDNYRLARHSPQRWSSAYKLFDRPYANANELGL